MDAVDAREHLVSDNVASGFLSGYGRRVFERPPIPEMVHENIAVNGCGLLVAFDEREQAMSVTMDEMLQMKAPLCVVDAETFTDKEDVGPDGEEIENGYACENEVLLVSRGCFPRARSPLGRLKALACCPHRPFRSAGAWEVWFRAAKPPKSPLGRDTNGSPA